MYAVRNTETIRQSNKARGIVLIAWQLPTADQELSVCVPPRHLGSGAHEHLCAFPRIEASDKPHQRHVQPNSEFAPDPVAADSWIELFDVDPVWDDSYFSTHV